MPYHCDNIYVMSKKMKHKGVKLDSETLRQIWMASRPNIYKNKKKYNRKNNK